jgi:hypothetical protein
LACSKAQPGRVPRTHQQQPPRAKANSRNGPHPGQAERRASRPDQCLLQTQADLLKGGRGGRGEGKGCERNTAPAAIVVKQRFTSQEGRERGRGQRWKAWKEGGGGMHTHITSESERERERARARERDTHTHTDTHRRRRLVRGQPSPRDAIHKLILLDAIPVSVLEWSNRGTRQRARESVCAVRRRVDRLSNEEEWGGSHQRRRVAWRCSGMRVTSGRSTRPRRNLPSAPAAP